MLRICWGIIRATTVIVVTGCFGKAKESLCAHVAIAAYVAVWCWGNERTSSAFHLYITEWGQYANVCCHLLVSVIQPYLARCFLWVSSLLNCSVAIGKLKCVASCISLACFSIRVGINIFLFEGLECNLDHRRTLNSPSFIVNPPVIY